MYCKQCGNFVDENKDKFCMNCGLAVDGEDVKQVEEYKNNLGDTIFYYASETLSIFFLFSFFLDLYYGDETSAVSDILYFVATINMHKIAISRLIKNNRTINLLSIILEKLIGMPVKLLDEPSYIYNNARKRNLKINIVIMVICIILGEAL